MRAVDIIMKKRSGAELSRQEIEFLIGGYVAGSIPDYQVSAWAMAVFFRGMTPAETGVLTETMLRSGSTIDLSGLSGPFVDKHSTGGVGDKTSLIIAPMVAALGIRDPMMSGRALGHTGGTLDKLESIPGYRTNLSVPEFRSFLEADGFAMTGQTKEIVPADRLLYALRDVTGTVESIPLITASILSKKVAEGAEALVFDVKCGSGAFMKDPADAERLARSLVDTGTAMGKKVVALLTDMDEPLGAMVGNFLEVEESLDCLEGAGPEDLMEVTLELAARMAVLAGKATTPEEGRRLCEGTIASGEAKKRFLDNVARQGGDVDRMLSLRGSYRSPHAATVAAERDGYIARLDAWKIGLAGVSLGVGRNRTEDAVSPDVGVRILKKSGSPVRAGEPVMAVWGKDRQSLESALPLLRESVVYAPEPPKQRTLVIKEIA
jgi:pyrimidine-nucleoside phosphorylase